MTDPKHNLQAAEGRETAIREAGQGAGEPPRRRFEDLPPAAQRALREAEERRAKAEPLALAPEVSGREGPEPVRFGDWEKKGIASDF